MSTEMPGSRQAGALYPQGMCLLFPRGKVHQSRKWQGQGAVSFSHFLFIHNTLRTFHNMPTFAVECLSPGLDAGTKLGLWLGCVWKCFMLWTNSQELRVLGNVSLYPGVSPCGRSPGISWSNKTLSLNFLTEAWGFPSKSWFWEFYRMKDSQTTQPCPVWDVSPVLQCPVHDHIAIMIIVAEIWSWTYIWLLASFLLSKHETPCQLRSLMHKRCQVRCSQTQPVFPFISNYPRFQDVTYTQILIVVPGMLSQW